MATQIHRRPGGKAWYGLRTHCSRGHEYTPENTRWRFDMPRPVRQCRKCDLERVKARHARVGR